MTVVNFPFGIGDSRRAVWPFPPRIHAQATVDTLISGRKYRVNVTGDIERRSYVLLESTEDKAAAEGLRLFVAEMGG